LVDERGLDTDRAPNELFLSVHSSDENFDSFSRHFAQTFTVF
jgi:hypothetical protein